MTREALDSLDKEALVQLILALQERIAALEAGRGPRKTPKNSSLPPAQGQKPSEPLAEPTKRKSHPGAARTLHPQPTDNRQIRAAACQHCGHDVCGAPQSPCEAYDHIDIPPVRPYVTRITLMGGTCPCCAKAFKAPPPADMAPGSPFGANLRALIVYLRYTQGIALERLSTLLHDMFGLDISQGAIVNILKAARPSFAAQTTLIRQALLCGTAIASDETGLRIGKSNGWMWVFHHGLHAVFVAAMSRGKQVVADFLGDWRPDLWLSDRYAGQLGWAKRDQQVCLAHLIRDVQYALDAGDTVFAPALRHLLGRACRIGARRGRLADTTLKAYERRLERDLDKVMKLKPAHAAGETLQQVFRKIRGHLFVFVTERDIEPTNNGSERALRPCVTFRKITNGMRTKWGADLYADVRSVLESARRHAIGALDAVRLTLAGQPLAP